MSVSGCLTCATIATILTVVTMMVVDTITVTCHGAQFRVLLWIKWVHHNLFCALDLSSAEGTATSTTLRVLPCCQTRCTQQVTTGLYPNIFTVLCTYLAQLECRAHLTVELILLLCHLDMVLRCGLHCPAQVWVDTPTIRVQVTGI